jgi:hypothetical protein
MVNRLFLDCFRGGSFQWRSSGPGEDKISPSRQEMTQILYQACSETPVTMPSSNQDARNWASLSGWMSPDCWKAAI